MKLKVVAIIIEDVGMCDVMPRFQLKMESSKQKPPILFQPMGDKFIDAHDTLNKLDMCLKHRKHKLTIGMEWGATKPSYQLHCNYCGFNLIVKKTDETFPSSHEHRF
ncbi:hypothetical protein A2303_07005 [Candidatus Falkowbacteria bacterium RIFOXYB2_FULL_47_14]|uniref:Uncharacterized protein n=1 Tax=Candidatus Falkowbacteria bacterium RIFOXYA2_FULL_47_19 TaxID=1797994 RepID=A0A1F5SG89_9BACT|nr:MAG: hypothetical protein A2227_00750 [Candidatus Falkowbacteria bacterium RIFOXYA2_FULL_47_19]OGF34902.1 MAG: hypothetical protein A2468_06710 [Candidatus Falkowbacteria bacterium RIFOXYC2_FULL_46_15]OGF43617.1 MAG: hypothetical protein A2303_07005 [Candidatus Falkowbacteria bacterium RIFOXYB2_FULL_47_14]